MDHYHSFSIANYMYAYYAAETDDARIHEDMERYLKYLPLDKVYVEFDIAVEPGRSMYLQVIRPLCNKAKL